MIGFRSVFMFWLGGAGVGAIVPPPTPTGLSSRIGVYVGVGL